MTDVTSSFDAFWEIVPRKTGKGAARKSYAKAITNGANPDTIHTAMLDHREWAHRPGQDPQFVPLPSTWLNQERWDDEIPADPSDSDDPLVRYRGTSTGRILGL